MESAPLGVYRQSGLNLSMGESLIAMQHGSYLIAALESQPLIDRGEAVLYRGCSESKSLHFAKVDDYGYAFTTDECLR